MYASRSVKKKNLEQIENQKFIIFNIPRNTEESEVHSLLKGWYPKVNIVSMNFARLKHNPNYEQSFMCFVQVVSNEERDAILNYYEQFSKKTYPPGIQFVNNVGIKARLCLNYCFSKNTMQSQCENLGTSGSDPVLNENSDILSYDDVEVIKSLAVERKKWEKQKEGLKGYVHLLEKTLKEKSPLLFVSELELYGLENEQKDVGKQKAGAQEKVKASKIELQDINHQIEKLFE